MRKHKGDGQEKVFIIVYGGVVQAIYSSTENIQIKLLDFDNEKFPDDESAKRSLEMKIKGLTELSF